MSRSLRSVLVALLGLLLGVLAQPLQAQLDPRLQNSNTDFLNLFQQSTAAKPKPEIVTIFDASESMNTLMYHPLYNSQDTQDADDYNSMEFQLTGGGTGTAYTNTFTITATNSNCTSATASGLVTILSATTASFAPNGNAQACNGAACNNAPPITITASATGDGSAKTTLVFTPTAGANPTYTVTAQTNTGAFTGAWPYSYTMETSGGSNGGTSTPTITFTAWTSSAKTTPASVPYKGGTYFVFTCYLAHQMDAEGGENSADQNISWAAGIPACGSSSAGGNPSATTNGVASPSTSSSFFQSTATWTMPTWTASAAGTTAQLAAMALASSSPAVAPGAKIQLVTYFVPTFQGGASSNITWKETNGNNPCPGVPAAVNPVLTGGSGSTTTAGTTLGSATTVTWTVPSTFCVGNSPAANYTVTVTLIVKPRAHTPQLTLPGITALTSNLSATTNIAGDLTSVLRKPSGAAVVQADADAAKTGSMATPSLPSLAYEASGAADVRNWVRAASHVRLPYTYTNPQTNKSVTRTLDLPIPWKIMDRTTYETAGGDLTAQNPLPSTTILDKEVETTVVSGAPVTTTYGSSTQIEMDQSYKVESLSTNATFASGPEYLGTGGALTKSVQTNIYLYSVVYRPLYLAFLYTGVYQNTNPTWPAYTTDSALYGTAGANYVAFDAANGALVPNQGTANLSWGQGFGPKGTSWGTIKIPQYKQDGSYLGDTTPNAQALDASTIATPSLTRLQAVKKAAISTWIAHQADVYWAFRELDPTNEAASGSKSTIDNNSLTTLSAVNPTTTYFTGNDSGWTVLNNTTGQGINSLSGNSITGMNRIAYMFANGETPLTYAVARTLAQYQDPNSIFNAIEGVNVSQCSNSFLLLFTDGVDNNAGTANNGNNTTPYITGTPAVFNAKAGNDSLLLSPTNVDTTGSWWNLYTFAGMAAHLSDPSMGTVGTDYMKETSPGTTVTSGAPHAFMPFAISQRGNTANSNFTQFNSNHRVTTMTIGVSLGGVYTDPTSPKAALFNAAVVGDPSTTSGALSTFHTFQPPPSSNITWPAGGWAGVNATPPTYPPGWTPNDWVVNPQDPNDYPTVGMRAPGAVYFFDGQYPSQLQSAMNYAFTIAIGTASNNASSNPNLPFVGSSLGQEVYMGTFQPPITGGVIWPGDLQMFATRTSATGAVTFVDQNGNPTTILNGDTAQWTASSALANRLWSNRNLYTRLPATSATEPGLTSFTTGNANLLPYVATGVSSSDSKKAIIQFASGGNTASVTAPTPPTTNRSNIMGDIIDSAPAAISYDFSQVSSSLTTRLSAVNGNTFRLVLVGDNQGWLHAFGEVAKSGVKDPNGDGLTLTTGSADELWAFMPTDFLANLDYITNNTNPHVYMCDGSPATYFLNLPTSSGAPGSGVVEKTERAVVVFGLGKGGRSYYAIDIHNPYTPALLWSLRPDEAAAGNFDTTRNKTSNLTNSQLTTLISNMGYSTASPALGRVTFNGVVHDCVFLSGGLSEPEVEANFPTSGKPTPMGRSVLALDVYSGQVLAAVDLTSSPGGFWQTGVGPIYGGVVPFEFILNSGFAQRAYFTDYTGGLWAWGARTLATTAPYVNFRIDSSEITNWSIRKVFQDDNNANSGRGGRYSTVPAPFLVTNFPGPAIPGGSAVPTAVGVAMVSGDRNNPLDESYNGTTNIRPLWHDLIVLFDRQDSNALGLDKVGGPDTGIQPGLGTSTSLLVPLNTTAITEAGVPATPCSDAWFKLFTPGCSSYFLGTANATTISAKYGYYVPFTSPINPVTTSFLPKGITAPVLVSNELLYSFFTPLTSNSCTGGSGNTYSYIISNVLSPIAIDQRSGQSIASGAQATFTGVASNFITVGTTSVLQGGTQTTTNSSGVSTVNPVITNTSTQPGSRFPKIRVWRDVQ